MARTGMALLLSAYIFLCAATDQPGLRPNHFWVYRKYTLLDTHTYPAGLP